MSAPADKAKWIARYDDGSEKIEVSYDRTSERLPDHIHIEMSSDSWVYVDVADVEWLCARLLDASVAIKSNPGDDNGR